SRSISLFPYTTLFRSDRTAGTQVVKQADLVLLSHLLSNRFNRESIAQTFEYYEPRCDHGSSLSPSIHALVAARLGRLDQARSYRSEEHTSELQSLAYL